MATQNFESYNFEQDEKFKLYFSNLSFPPSMTQEELKNLTLKYKIKYYKQNVNPSFPSYEEYISAAQTPAPSTSSTSASTAHKTKEELEEHFDEPEVVEAKAKKLADAIRKAKHFVIYTGAGISTSSGIPDFRGPQGKWTMKAQGVELKPVEYEKHKPTYAHYAIKELLNRGLAKYLVSTNTDGLHLRSGIPPNQIAELHGNSYKEFCTKCGKVYLRAFNSRGKKGHLTGRSCSDCGGELHDTIIHFGENLPEKTLEEAIEHSTKCDLSIVMGSSLRVNPAAKLPYKCAKAKRGQMYIVNLQWTPYDEQKNTVKVHARTDEFLKLVMKELGIESFDMTFDALDTVK